MLSVINVLILFFIILIVCQIFLAMSNVSIIEGLTGFPTPPPPPFTMPNNPQSQSSSSTSSQYQPYNSSNALILAQQNAGNIQVLKQQLDGLMTLNQEVQDISGNVAALQAQVTGIIQAQQQYAQQMTPSTTPTITGAVNNSS